MGIVWAASLPLIGVPMMLWFGKIHMSMMGERGDGVTFFLLFGATLEGGLIDEYIYRAITAWGGRCQNSKMFIIILLVFSFWCFLVTFLFLHIFPYLLVLVIVFLTFAMIKVRFFLPTWASLRWSCQATLGGAPRGAKSNSTWSRWGMDWDGKIVSRCEYVFDFW